jgi:enterochelin esterase family protein
VQGVVSRAVTALAVLLCALPASAQQGAAPFASLAELDAALAAVEAGASPDPLWMRVTAAHTMPLTFGLTAVFLHRTKAPKVEWRGDFNGWDSTPDWLGKRVGQSDLWTQRRSFLEGARLDYKIVENGGDWLLDPLNPFQQLGGYGPNSELRMPGYVAPDHTRRGPEVPHGTLLRNELVPSKRLGYGVNLRVYQPARKEGDTAKLPVLFVTDGSDYYDSGMGSLVATLDNLIAQGRIPPLLAVFVDPWDPEHKENRREREYLGGAKPREKAGACPYCDFLALEVAPLIDSRYATDPTRRGVLGVSLGGVAAALTGLRHPAVFPLLGLQSPSVWALPALPQQIERSKEGPRRVALDVGLYEGEEMPAGGRALRAAYQQRKAAVLYREVPEGHSWGHWKNTVAEALSFLYGVR